MSAHVDSISRGLKIAGESRDVFLGLVPGLVESAGSMSVPELTAEVMKAAKSVVTDGGLSTFEDQRRSTYLKIWNDAAGMVNVRGAFEGSAPCCSSGCKPKWKPCSTPVTGTCRSDVVVHVDLETLTSGLSASSTHRTVFGADLPVETIRRISCDANIIPLVLSGAGMPLDIGRGQRLASAAQRRALEATHDTCAFDGCAVAFHACQIHHIEAPHGGPTDLDNPKS